MKRNVLIIGICGVALAAIFNSCKKEDVVVSPTTNLEDLRSDDEDIVTPYGHILGLKLMSQEQYKELPVLEISDSYKLPAPQNLEHNMKVNPSVLTISTPAVQNQGNEGSCVAWTFGYLYSSWIRRAFYHETNAYTYGNCYSPEYLHNNCKTSSSCGAGCYMTTVLNFLKNTGAPRLNYFPVNYNSCSLKTTTATKTKIRNWSTVSITESSLKYWLNYGYPVAIALTVDNNFYSQTYNSPYILSSRGGTTYGGHAVTIVGYDDNKQAFKVQNQWGTGVQMGGYFYIKYSSVSTLVHEAYVAW